MNKNVLSGLKRVQFFSGLSSVVFLLLGMVMSFDKLPLKSGQMILAGAFLISFLVCTFVGAFIDGYEESVEEETKEVK